jgi:hypothetical protein
MEAKMNTTQVSPDGTNRKNARWAGVFYIIATVAPILTVSFIGFLGGGIAEGEPIPGYLGYVSTNETQVIIGMLIELIWTLAVVGIIVTLLPILKKYSETFALWFSGLRFIEAIGNVIHALILLTLVTLSHEYAAAGAPDASHFQTIGALLLAGREWAFMIGSGLIWSLSAVVLNYGLYRSRLIPRWLSGWGFAAAIMSLTTYFLQFFGIELSEFMFLPIALQEMVFALWLIFKGISASASVSEPAETAA